MLLGILVLGNIPGLGSYRLAEGGSEQNVSGPLPSLKLDFLKITIELQDSRSNPSTVYWSEGGAQLRRTAYVLPVRPGARGVSQTGAAGYDADCVPPPGRIATGRRAHFSQKI